jgi:4-hydroxy-4-methyl-2-oxoglutarate aldolase
MTSMPAPSTGKQGIIPSVIVSDTPRPSGAEVLRIGEWPVADISDLVGRLYTMTSEIRPLYQPAPRLLGTALTVRAPRGDNAAVKAALAMLRDGDVLVIDAQGFTDWCCGGFNMLRQARASFELGGVLVNGAYRDVADFASAGLPLYGIAANPATGPKLGPGEINVPVSCGNVIVNPGDIVYGDPDGVAVVPRQHVSLIIDVLDQRRGRRGSP